MSYETRQTVPGMSKKTRHQPVPHSRERRGIAGNSHQQGRGGGERLFWLPSWVTGRFGGAVPSRSLLNRWEGTALVRQKMADFCGFLFPVHSLMPPKPPVPPYIYRGERGNRERGHMTTYTVRVNGRPRPQPRARFVPGRRRPVSVTDPKIKLYRDEVIRQCRQVPELVGPVDGNLVA